MSDYLRITDEAEQRARDRTEFGDYALYPLAARLDVAALVTAVRELVGEKKAIRDALVTRLGTSEASRDRDDWKRGYAQGIEYAISLLDVPPAALSPASPAEPGG